MKPFLLLLLVFAISMPAVACGKKSPLEPPDRSTQAATAAQG